MGTETLKHPEVNSLRQKSEAMGLKAVLFDLDGTLVNISQVFRETREEFGRELAKLAGRPEEEGFFKRWRAITHALRREMNVIPGVHEYVARIVCREWGVDSDSPEARQLIDGLSKVYEIVPEEMPGARQAVRTIKAAGVDVAVVTHGEPGWTWDKMRGWRGEFLRVFPTDVGVPKDWRCPLAMLGLEADEVIGVGDNWTADVLPLVELGAKRVFWLRNDRELPAEIPSSVEVIESMEDLVRAILALEE